ncbi:hypothetical protein [Sphaerisporangium dianthi]|uniref:Tat pathway signal sequence domain protein n=1 Tax=Sphaerisporangium dianthi TaxID=1436120 RepID=A0ABV9CPB6_9ACTN
MNDTFENRLLAELKAEMAASAPREITPAPRRITGRRILAGAGAVGAVAAATITVPMLIAPASPAYALTKNADGSLTLTIHEFSDPEAIENDLASRGVKADVTYMPLGKRCDRSSRRSLVGGQAGTATKGEFNGKDPAAPGGAGEAANSSLGSLLGKAFRVNDGITIYPKYIKPGQTAVIEVAENAEKPTAEHPGVAWRFTGGLVDGPVQPCRLVDDPGAFDIGNATPPPGS